MKSGPSGESQFSFSKPRLILLMFSFIFFTFSGVSDGAIVKKDRDVIFIQSRSGQFFANAPKNIADSLPADTSTNAPKTIKLDPNFLVVISERIKDRLLFSLNLKDAWKGRIFLSIFPARTHSDPVFVNAQYTDNGWLYYVDLPSHIELNKLIRVIVEVLLQEIADRTAGSKPAELPPWLAAALSFQIQYEATDISLMEPFTKKTRLEKKRNPLDLIRKHLQFKKAMNWEELCWTTEEDLVDFSPTNHYNMCSFLFYYHLLKLPGGASNLHKFFEILPSFWNWQVAFIKAFEPHFYSMRDVEKWWSVTLSAFTGMTEFRTLTAEQTIDQLDDILDSPVKMPTTTNEPPVINRLSVQSIILNSGINQHKELLKQKLANLNVLRQRSHPALIRLIDDYRVTIESYLRRRTSAGYEPEMPRLPRENPRSVIQQTINKLNELDLIRSDIRLYGIEEQTADLLWFSDEGIGQTLEQPGENVITNTAPVSSSSKAKK